MELKKHALIRIHGVHVSVFSSTAKIHYQPALPTQREFLTQNMPVGHMIKFIITYQTVSNR